MISTIFQRDIFELTRHLPTPVMIIDLERLRQNIRAIRRALPGAALFYAVKCNADPRVLAVVQRMGAGFEIASISEAEIALSFGLPPERIICLHPIKSPDFLRFLHRHGIDTLAADSFHELDKIAEHAPGSRVVIRVSVSNEGSLSPLTGKFGVEPQAAVRLLRHAQSLGLSPYGITIHVGSQCERLETWVNALKVCEWVCQQARLVDLKLSLISLGGGLPAPYSKTSPSMEATGAAINEAISRLQLPEDCSLSIEPGRAVVASAGTLIATVVGMAERADGAWAYIDAGVYHGLFEATPPGGHIPYPIAVKDARRPPRVYNIGGPTCDSFDRPFDKLQLPELRVGDRIAIHLAGAYSTALSSTFNGFPAPAIHYFENLVG